MNVYTCGLALAALCASSAAQSHASAPAANSNLDAEGHLWLAGAGEDHRQQTIIGASHLTALVNKQITALEFRRDADDAAFTGGAAQWTVTLSSSAAPTYDCSEQFAANTGSDAVQVFQGQVTLPASPAAPGPAVAWSADNVVRVVFQTPFSYGGGRLCVDITGAAVPGQEARGWLPDAASVDATGVATSIGGGCGPFATQNYADVYGLSVGSTARFTGGGTPNFFGFAMTGPTIAAPLPLSVVGFGQPNSGCTFLVDPTIVVPVFLSSALTPTMGIGTWQLGIPNNSALQGQSLTTQWLDWATETTTDALTWTIGASHTIDMATIEGDAQSATGHLATSLAHVIRFEFQ